MSDDELLGALAATFPVERAEPDAASLQHLARAVATLRPEAPAPSTTRPSPRWTMGRRLSPAVLAGAVVGIVGAGTGISYAVGTPLPSAVRSIARSVGLARPAKPPTLPVVSPPPASPAVNAARQAESTLDHALAQSSPAAGVISHDSSVLAQRLAQVGQKPGAGVPGLTADGHHLLDQACQQLGGGGRWEASYGNGISGESSGTTDTPGVHCAAVGVGSRTTTPGNTAVSVPSTTPGSGTTSPLTHPGAGTSGGPVKATTGGSSPSTGYQRTTPGTTTPGTTPVGSIPTGSPPVGSSGGHGSHDVASPYDTTSSKRSSTDPAGGNTISHTENPAG